MTWLLFSDYLTTVTGSGNKIKSKTYLVPVLMEIYSLLEESDINQVIPNIYLQIVLDLMRAQCRGI